MSSPLLLLPNTYRAFYGAFSALHPFQHQVIDPLLKGKDLVLQAATGSGKTEAVLAPCIERVIQSGRAMAVVYVVPTRALAVDIERRIGPTINRLGLSMGMRTGDVKRAGGARPDLLITTPESLDVALGSANADLRQFVQRIGSVIIDEVHPLVHAYRGRQLSCLLQRLARRADKPVQKIALSATIADIDAVIACFGLRADAVRIISPVQRDIAPHLVHLKNDTSELVQLIDDLHERYHYRKILMFANSRSRCDRLFSLLNHNGAFQGMAELHYSNLKPKARQAAEHRFRRRAQALCIATSTLELGIDIGDVDGVVLYEPPDSASAFLQRIGRANRRAGKTQVWGICRGESAQRQLLQFLGMLHLSQQGIVETTPPRILPSVFVQQILSCLYEKKRLSPEALCDLFPEHKPILDDVFVRMAQTGWLRKDAIPGLFRGSWRYRDCFMDRRIWSNFPEPEEEYALEFSGETIADLPQSIVRQLALGDRVPLIGKRLRIVKIDTGQRKRVVAQPAEHLDDKDIFWAGAGFQVSYEVAQAVRQVLQNEGAEPPDGLFSRAQKLLSNAQARYAHTVQLHNGIAVGRTIGGLYRYHTHLGTIGNAIVQWAIARAINEEELSLSSDALGIDCSHWIDFQSLSLPTTRDAFQQWAEQHVETLTGLFSLNAFVSALPPAYQVAEIAEFLFDPRLAEAFQSYLTQSSDIASGDPAVLDEADRETPVWVAPEAPSLLSWEKSRWTPGTSALSADIAYPPRPLTGTRVGAYIHHQQCARWLSLSFSPPEQRPPEWREEATSLAAQRMERGNQHEARVLNHLQKQGETLYRVESDGPLSTRFDTTLALMQRHIHADAVLCQAVLRLPAALDEGIDGVGIPDLIRISKGTLTIGDIKDSRMPYDSQKWQVAFYAWLLKTLIQRQIIPISADVSDTGFLMLRGDALAPHEFDLQPYLDAMPMLLQNMAGVLHHPPAQASYHLQPHCTTCPGFAFCYREALFSEDIQFLPHLSAGALQKFRLRNIKTLDEAAAHFDRREPDALFSPHQRERLSARLSSLREHRIGLREKTTRLFPKNLSTAILLHLTEDPVSGALHSIGWIALRSGAVADRQTWHIPSDEAHPEVLRDVETRFLSLWRQSITGGRGPHVFHFGERVWQAFQSSAEDAALAFLGVPERTHHTDLRALIAAHFDLPAPGATTLFALSHLLGLKPDPDPPESLFHPDRSEDIDAALDLLVGIWNWVALHLESAWEQLDWTASEGKTTERMFLDFLEEERRLREEDVLTLQAYPLSERVARFRAIGPLQFTGTRLDEEGRFLYAFQTEPEVGLSKFRAGDFLKLARVGEADLQSGFPIVLFDNTPGHLQVLSRRGRLALNRQMTYSLEEDLTDWNGSKLAHAVQTVFSEHALTNLFAGQWAIGEDMDALRWAQTWLQTGVSGLNPMQQQALCLPFRHRLGLIEGPPGTGKTHVLGWTLIALIQRARDMGRPLRIAVSALTHQAIDQVLSKVATLVERHELPPIPCLKWGRQTGDAERVEPLRDAETLADMPHAILGATGFGLYQMFEGQKGHFPQVFDYVVFDEASQVLIPQALLSLLYGKGRFLFLGDVKQLPPIVLGESDSPAHHSVLSHLSAAYDPALRIRLDLTYRMSEALCAFPSQTWYDGELRPAPENAHQRLSLPDFQPRDLTDRILHPDKPVALVMADHIGCHQQSDVEVEMVAALTHRLMAQYGLSADHIALISPHRAQNNTIAHRLAQVLGEETPLPLIDTVERVQGAERDVILFAFTTSDADHIASAFLNNPNRFNVAITRARKKLIVIGSRAFFTTVPQSEDALKANRCFKAFYAFCQARDSLFEWP